MNAPDHDGLPVYVFRGFRNSVSCAAPGRAVIEVFGTLEAFEKAFGGYMNFAEVPSERTWLGVWGARNASRFRRLLRERHGSLKIIEAEPPERLSSFGFNRKRLNAAQRRALEARLPGR